MGATRFFGIVTTTAIFWTLAAAQPATQVTAADAALASATSTMDTHICVPTTPETHDVSKNPGNGVFRSDGTFGNESLYTILGSKITFRPGGPGFVLADGSLSMKYHWWRLRNGHLTIEGKRLDGEAAPLRASIPSGYGDIGFQATGVIFPTPGCWEVTGRVGGDSITFIVLVEKIGDGPCGKADKAPNETGGQVAMTAWTEERITGSKHGLRKFRVSGEREYDGGKSGIRGNGNFSFVITRQPGKPATFIGDEKIKATIGEKQGSFTIRHNGNIQNGIARSTWEILNSSGTDELANIAGHGTFSSGLDDKACYSVIYSGI